MSNIPTENMKKSPQEIQTEELQTLKEKIGEDNYPLVERLAKQKFRRSRQEAGDIEFAGETEEAEAIEDPDIDRASTLEAEQLEEAYQQKKSTDEL